MIITVLKTDCVMEYGRIYPKELIEKADSRFIQTGFNTIGIQKERRVSDD